MCELDIAWASGAAYPQSQRTVKGMRIHQLTFFGFAALALFSGCEGGQTGDLSGHNDDGGQETGSSSGCDVHQQKLASFDAMTDSGSANQLLDYAERSFDAPITWRAPKQGQAWSVGPESGEGQLHIEVVRGESAYLLTYTPHVQTGSGGGIEIGVTCPPAELGVEARVSVTTDGGALAEVYDTLLRSSVPGVATFNVPFDPAQVRGSLSVSSSDPDAKLMQLRLDATLTSAGTTGSLAGIEQVQHGTGPNSAVSAMAAELAVWPNSAACGESGEGLPLPLEAEALGVSGEATLASVATEEPVAVQWLNGDETTLSVEIEGDGDGCFSVSKLPRELGGGPTASYPVTLRVKSADARLDGSFAGNVVVTGYGDERSAVAEAWLDAPVDETNQTGFASVNVPSGADSVRLHVVSSFVSGKASGSVRLIALTDPDCPAPTPTPTPGGGASSPGCPGQTVDEIERASWGD